MRYYVERNGMQKYIQLSVQLFRFAFQMSPGLKSPTRNYVFRFDQLMLSYVYSEFAQIKNEAE